MLHFELVLPNLFISAGIFFKLCSADIAETLSTNAADVLAPLFLFNPESAKGASSKAHRKHENLILAISTFSFVFYFFAIFAVGGVAEVAFKFLDIEDSWTICDLATFEVRIF